MRDSMHSSAATSFNNILSHSYVQLAYTRVETLVEAQNRVELQTNPRLWQFKMRLAPPEWFKISQNSLTFNFLAKIALIWKLIFDAKINGYLLNGYVRKRENFF